MFGKNIGLWDRIARIVIGVVLIVLSLMHIIGWWGWIGLIPLITGLISFCPLYKIFGFSSCPLRKKDSE